jgi:secreted trypsin-like serine protease
MVSTPPRELKMRATGKIGERVVGRLFSLILLVVLGSCGGGGDSGDGIGRNACGDFNTKIINGTECSIGGSPVVAVLVKGGSGGACSGFVVGVRSVLTAAHCFCDPADSVCIAGSTPSPVSVVLEGSREIAVSGVRIHPNYRIISDSRQPIGKLRNDVAVLTLSAPARVEPLPVYLSSRVKNGTTVGIFGYGADEEGRTGFAGFSGNARYRLESGRMRISGLRDGLIEAFFSGEGSNTCVGDSGGPMTVMLPPVAAIGVTSIGITEPGNLCKPGEIAAYTDLQDPAVSSFLRQSITDLATR